jgi:broad specificity phosphatase PhoE
MTTRLYLVRHGRAGASWEQHPDPGLDDTGRGQAEEAAEALAALGPLPMLSSPLRRARETAAPLEQRWRTAAIVDEGVGEIPSPTDDLAERGAWLLDAMRGTWSDLGGEYRRWRDGVVARLLKVDRDTVVFTHFIAINVAVGAATRDDRVVTFVPDNGSCTVLANDGGELQVLDLGHQAQGTTVR